MESHSAPGTGQAVSSSYQGKRPQTIECNTMCLVLITIFNSFKHLTAEDKKNWKWLASTTLVSHHKPNKSWLTFLPLQPDIFEIWWLTHHSPKGAIASWPQGELVTLSFLQPTWCPPVSSLSALWFSRHCLKPKSRAQSSPEPHKWSWV